MITTSRHFAITSADRISGSDPCNITLMVDIPTHETYTHVCLLAASIPKSYYLIQAGYNTFTLVELGVQIPIVVTPANYGANCFRVCLAAALNAASLNGWVYSIALPAPTDPQTGKFTYAVVGPAAIQPSFVCTTNIHEQLGFNADSTNTFVDGVLTSTNVISFQSEDSLYIHTDLVTDAGNDILQEIYNSGVPDFAKIKYQCSEWQTAARPLTRTKGNVYRFSLTDENQRLINLNGNNWAMTIAVFSIETPLMLKSA